MITHMVRTKRQVARRPRLAEYYQLYRDLASEGIAGLIDCSRQWAKIPDDAFPDGVHPTQEAHRAVTVPAIVRAISRYRKQMPQPKEKAIAPKPVPSTAIGLEIL